MDGQLLKHIRQVANYTQIELAAIVGVNQASISKIEAGINQMQPDTAQRIKQAFKEAGISEKDITVLHNALTQLRKEGEASASNIYSVKSD
ncbi:helix-turn-helix transcriptional regulator [Peribacillus sp. R9-11]|uniref:helix-turn-helix domain-containing protein n=1 Tax=Peribacillus sp. R9-11 TaxID=3073271 RepID=UPI0028692A6F|nr:helix-turn-helix transcriptional regulator [Peribacillus sp. R9-11]WMX55647.1 helix-turn-helix transcriptional regulator [Peribacillus sp. R9-11]